MSVDPLAPTLLSSAAGSALLIGALLSYTRWQRTGDALALLTSAFLAGLAGLARSELFVLSGALVVLVVFAPLPRARRARVKKEQRSAFAMAYAAAVGGLFGFWLLVTFLLPSDLVGIRDDVVSYAVQRVSMR